MKNIKVICRWILFLPTAFLGSWLAYMIFFTLNTIGVIDTNDFIFRVILDGGAHVIMGVAFVYIGTYIAPSNKRHICFALSGLGFFITGMLAFSAFLVRDYWAIFCTLCILFGIVCALCDKSMRES